MGTIKLSPLTLGLIPPDNAGVSAELGTVSETDSPTNGTSRTTCHAMPLVADPLVKHMEQGLESIVEKLLLSKGAEDDTLLATVQDIMERIFVRSAMRIAEGNISRAAKLLGINRNTLSKKLRVLDGRG